MNSQIQIKFRRILSNFVNNITKYTKMKSRTNIINICDEKSILLASNYLQQGQVIALPTDTIYGLACKANCPEAIQRLYSIKGRDINKPLAICVGDLKSLRFCGEASHLPDELLEKLLPGPFTVVLNKTINLNNPHLNQGINKIGIRIPNFQFIQDLCKDFNQPLALTSANRSNEPSSLSIEEFNELWPYLAAIFDGGKISLSDENRAGSTVIDLSVPGKCKILREGVAYIQTINVMNEYEIIVE